MEKKTIDDEALGVVCDTKANEAVGWFNSKLSLSRENVMRYYNGELPRRTSKGSSSFVSTDVYDAVESMKAQLLETFSTGNKIVKFDPQTPADVVDAQIATAYTEFVVFKQNDGYRIFGDIIHDGLIARVGVAKVWWEECEEYTDHEFSEVDEDEATGLASHPDVHSMEAEESAEGSGKFSGKLTRKADRSQVRIEVVNPEEFSVEPQAKTLSADTFCVQRSIKTIDDLVKMGYDRKKLESWNANDDTVLKSSPEVLARFQAIDSGVSSNNGSQTVQEEMRHVLVQECYLKCLRDGDDHAKLYKVVRVGTETLEIVEVEDLPFQTFVPLPIPHSFYGNNFGERVIPAQNARTVLTRSILDHTAITTNPRQLVLKGGVVNPKELLDNRLGGLVNVTRPDAVKPMEQANLNPFVFQTLELVKHHNEETTGISSLSQGLNKDAISKQNSGAMVEKLVSLSQTRQKIVARNFANGFLIPLFIKVYNLVLAKEKRKKIMEVAGQWHEVDIARWKERRAASVALRLGYGEIDHEADVRLMIAGMAAKDPVLNGMVSPQNRFKLITDVAELKGISNVLDYITPPDKVPPPQPDPMKQKAMELEERKIAALELSAKAAMSKVQAHVGIEELRQNLSKAQADFDNAMHQRDEDRKDSDIANKIDIAQREMAIVEKTPITTSVGNVSPR